MMDLAKWLYPGAIVLLLAVSAFLSASETALAAASHARLRQRAEKGSRGAAVALALKGNNERLVGALLLGNTFLTTAIAAIAAALFLHAPSGPADIALLTVILTFAVLILSGILPRIFAVAHPEAFACATAPVLSAVIAVLDPVMSAVRLILRVMLGLLGVRTTLGDQILTVREEIAGALAIGHSAGEVEKEDRDRLMGALDLSDRTVEEVMRHRSQIEMIDAEADPSELIAEVLASPHTRLPVYRGTRENIVGVIHAKDLLRAVDKFLRAGDGKLESVSELDILSVAMKPYFVPDTTPLDEQMREFLKRRTHFALVVDEYGELMGLITLEDIIEEITGEITDEFDIDSQHPLKRSETGEVVVDGAMTIRDFNRATEWTLPDDMANTVAGLVIHEAQLIPTPGQVFSFHGFRFEVLSRKENRVTRLKVRPL